MAFGDFIHSTARKSVPRLVSRPPACAAILLAVSDAAAQYPLLKVPTLGGPGDGQAISANGVLVVGESPSPNVFGSEAFYWTLASGTVSLGSYLGSYQSRAFGTSSNGTFICGEMDLPSGLQRPFLWTQSTGKMDLGTLPNRECGAGRVSDDGAVVIGYCYSSSLGTSAFTWTPSSGIQLFQHSGVGDLGLGYVSADGQVYGGWGEFADEPPPFTMRAFRWTAGTGIVKLHGQPTNRDVLPTDFGDNAQAACGYTDFNGEDRQAFVWKEPTGFMSISKLAGFPDCYGQAISGDGSIVGGHCINGGTYLAWLFAPSPGLRTASEFLAERGAIIQPGASIHRVVDISLDGQAILLHGCIPGQGCGPILARLCYANCDGSTTAPFLTGNDFACFINRFVAYNPAANCDGSTTQPVLSANDFMCFLDRFVAGCS